MTTFSAQDLTVVIPTRGRSEILDETLVALERQTVEGFDVVVVVDGLDQQGSQRGSTRTIRVPKGGPGAARNRGVAETARELVLFLGDDMVPVPELVARHLARHNAEPSPAVAVMGTVQWHPRARGKGIHRWMDRSSLQFDFGGLRPGDDAGWIRFYSCNVSLKRSFFLSAGGFDPDFSYYYEDMDFGRRLGEAGLILRYEPAALTRHRHSYDMGSIRRRFAGVATGERAMAAKHDWFVPFFAARFRAVKAEEPEAAFWPAVEPLPWVGALKARVERHADRWYLQQVADSFLDVWDGEADVEELKLYLGPVYDQASLERHQQLVDSEEEAAPDEATFYRTSQFYLYDLTVFALSGTKSPYRNALRRHLAAGARLLDYGCGIGSDGLRFMADGYDVSFADFDNPSTRYLRWRLDRRGSSASIYDIDQEVPGGFDAVFSFDVIEHVEDPFDFLSQLESRARLVAVNLLEPDPSDTHLHKPLPIKEIVRRARRHRVLHNRLYHGRSHLLIYEV
jgi:GT2 family glycosyltransferase